MSRIRVLSLSLLAAATLAFPASAAAADNPYAKGPDPTVNTLRVAAGPYKVTKTSIPDDQTPGFGAGTLWTPQAAPGETFGGIAIIPGFLSVESAIQWLGPRLAARGFVVVTFNTNDDYEGPVPRSAELLAALDWLTTTSASRALVDPTRLAVMGHSAGGGGSLEAALRRPSLKALVAMQPGSANKNLAGVRVPSLVFAGQNDPIAAKETQAIPLYNAIPAATPKLYAEIKNGDHFSSNSPNVPTAALSIAWLKRYVDNDARYTQFIAPYPFGAPLGSLSAARNSSLR